jgi:hypothetical protein
MIYFSKYRNFEGEKIDFERLKIIEKVTGEKHYFSKTIFKLSNSGCECLSQKIEFIKDDFPISIRVKYLKVLSQELNCLLDLNLIHGDLNQKNIRLGKDGYYVIDFEPILLYKDSSKLMCTYPYLNKIDYKSNVLTEKTDKLSFDIFIKKKLKYPFSKRLTIDYVNYLFEKTNNHYNLNFSQILNNNLKNRQNDLSKYN